MSCTRTGMNGGRSFTLHPKSVLADQSQAARGVAQPPASLRSRAGEPLWLFNKSKAALTYAPG